jgi:hypothetical protein
VLGDICSEWDTEFSAFEFPAMNDEKCSIFFSYFSFQEILKMSKKKNICIVLERTPWPVFSIVSSLLISIQNEH